jgi:hypothetical protein
MLSTDRMIEDKAIILTLLHESYDMGLPALTRIQVHKFLFMSEQQMWRNRILTSGFRFIKMDHGPWSQDIEDTIKQLESMNLIMTTPVTTASGDNALLTRLTNDGKLFADSIIAAMKTTPWASMMHSIEKVIQENKDKSSLELAEYSHSLKNYVTGMTVHDTPNRKYLLRPRPKAQTSMILELEESIKETLQIMDDSELRSSVLTSIEQGRRGAFRPYHPGEVSTNAEEHCRD